MCLIEILKIHKFNKIIKFNVNLIYNINSIKSIIYEIKEIPPIPILIIIGGTTLYK